MFRPLQPLPASRVGMKDVITSWANSSGDVKNASHYMRMDTCLDRHFCLLAVATKNLGMTERKVETRTLRPDTLVFPVPTTLPMLLLECVLLSGCGCDGLLSRIFA